MNALYKMDQVLFVAQNIGFEIWAQKLAHLTMRSHKYFFVSHSSAYLKTWDLPTINVQNIASRIT